MTARRSSVPALALAALLLLLAPLLGACSRQSGAGRTARARRGAVTRPEPLRVMSPPLVNRACELLTKDDAEEVLGAPVGAPITRLEPSQGQVFSRCAYIAQGVKPSRVLRLEVRTWQDAGEAKHAFERAHTLAQSVSGQAPQTISGLGTRAFWDGGTVSQLNVLAGPLWMTFGGTAGPSTDPQPQDRAAAEKALAHLHG